MKPFIKSAIKNEAAFTGLEAAIVLIAFVVVAAVFSYVVLGAGFFTTQKSDETVHTAVEQASSAVEIAGNVYGIADAAGSTINRVNFSISLAAGATPVDINKTVLTFSTNASYQTLTFDPTLNTLPDTSGHWSISHLDNTIGSDNKILDRGEQFTITVYPPVNLPAYTSFDIDIKPPVGAALAVHRTIPAYTNRVNLLY